MVEPPAFSDRFRVTSARPSPSVMELPSAGVKFGLLETAEAVSVPRRRRRLEPVKAEEPRSRTWPVSASLSMTRLLPAMVPRMTSVWPAAAPIEEGAVRVMPRLAAKVTPAVARRRPPESVISSAVRTVGTAPKARSLDTARVPAATTVLPTFVLAPVSVRVPVPTLVRAPRPERTPE